MSPKKVQGLVLVVDDVEANRFLAQAFLEMIGWKVEVVNQADEAQAFLKHTIPQAMLLDVRMPGLSGDELARLLRADPLTKDMRLVAYTAHAMPDEVASFLDAGFDEVLIKPVLLDGMKRVLPFVNA
jgi:two-component system cell cycle response regulator DivK